MVLFIGCERADENRVRENATRFYTAINEGDYQSVCDLLSVGGQKKLRLFAAEDSGVKPPVTCTRAARGFLPPAPGEAVRVTDVEVEGDTATVAIEAPGSDDPDAGGSADLVKEDGEWKIGQEF